MDGLLLVPIDYHIHCIFVRFAHRTQSKCPYILWFLHIQTPHTKYGYASENELEKKLLLLLLLCMLNAHTESVRAEDVEIESTECIYAKRDTVKA